jgi:hypothetical protein
MQPKIGDLARTALGFVASIAGGLIALLGALVLAGIFMAFGEYGAPASAPRLCAPSHRAWWVWHSSRQSSSALLSSSQESHGLARLPRWFWCLASLKYLR